MGNPYNYDFIDESASDMELNLSVLAADDGLRLIEFFLEFSQDVISSSFMFYQDTHDLTDPQRPCRWIIGIENLE